MRVHRLQWRPAQAHESARGALRSKPAGAASKQTAKKAAGGKMAVRKAK
jgi:hypothetical protein